jgi:serine/threonine protein kinase
MRDTNIETLEPNSVIHDRYLVVCLIGRGGMGAVYEATDQRLGNRVALKQKLVNGARLAKAFEREARLLARLHHPALPRVTDYFSERSDQFLVMEFIPGENLAELLKRRERTFGVQEVLLWGDQLLDALQYLHRQQPIVVHRDIKPQNLKQHTNGGIVLLDFGLAKGGIALGEDSSLRSLPGATPAYAPLEQLHGTGTEPRCDVYALAATLHHLLTGRPPVDALTRAAALLNRQPDPYRSAHELNPGVPSAVGHLLSRMLALAVNERPSDVDGLRAELRRAFEQAQSSHPHACSPAVHDSGPEMPTASWPPTNGIAPGPQPEVVASPPVRMIVSPALRRAQFLAPVLQAARVLWVDDDPLNVRPFCGILNSLGVAVDLVTSTSEALASTANTRYQLIISDIERDGIADEGLAFLRALHRRGPHPKVIFFIANLDPQRGTPPGAFGITSSGEDLLHLVFDVLERECL